jgi:hypothetical protein
MPKATIMTPMKSLVKKNFSLSFQYFFKIDKKSHQGGSHHDPAKMFTIPKEVYV